MISSLWQAAKINQLENFERTMKHSLVKFSKILAELNKVFNFETFVIYVLQKFLVLIENLTHDLCNGKLSKCMSRFQCDECEGLKLSQARFN